MMQIVGTSLNILFAFITYFNFVLISEIPIDRLYAADRINNLNYVMNYSSKIDEYL